MLMSLQRTSRVRCGFASLADVMTGRLDDRMDSYFLSETLKYLFLTFDDALRQRPNRRDLAYSAALSHADIQRAFARCSATLTDGAHGTAAGAALGGGRQRVTPIAPSADPAVLQLCPSRWTSHAHRSCRTHAHMCPRVCCRRHAQCGGGLRSAASAGRRSGP